MQNNITETHTVGLALNVLKLTPLCWLVAGDMFVIFNIQYLYSLNQRPTYSEVNLDTGISITGSYSLPPPSTTVTLILIFKCVLL